MPDADVLARFLSGRVPIQNLAITRANALMSLAKARKMNPRQLATDVLAKLDVSVICERSEIAGAGFLNFRLKTSAVVQTLESAARGEHLFFEKDRCATAQTHRTCD